MNNAEFSNEFDTLLNSYNTAESSIELDEYEKSVLLTKAQEDLIISIYTGKTPTGDSFENTEEIRRSLSNLVLTSIIDNKEEGINGLAENSVFYKLPDNLWFITYESAIIDDTNAGCKNNTEFKVVPITQDSYALLKGNPFRGANDRRILRLDLDNNVIELISKYNIKSYKVRYLSKPTPIILEDLPKELTINGYNKYSECTLSSSIHREILDRAVKLALISKSVNTKN